MDGKLEENGGGGEHGNSRKSGKTVSLQVTLAFLTNFSNIAPGMSLGFSAVAIPVLKGLTASQLSWFASVASLATPLGCFVAGPIADKYGRKNAIFCVNLSGFIGWAIIATAYYFDDYQYPLLLAGRVFTGLSTGLCGCPASIYMAEVATSDLRGVFTTWVSLFYAVGIFLVYLFGLILQDQWGMIALIAAIFPLVGTIFLTFLVPESPSWLISKNRHELAKKNMCKLFRTKTYTEDVHSELQALLKTYGNRKSSGEKKSIGGQISSKLKLFCKPSFVKPFNIVAIFFIFQQFSGIFVVMFFAIDIVKAAKVEIDAYIAIVIIASVRLVAMLIMSYGSKHFGRRPLSLISGVGMTICMLLLGGYILFAKENDIPKGSEKLYGLIPLILLNLYFFVSTVGFYPIPFAIAAEVFPSNIRGTASGIAVSANYVFNFIAVKLYDTMKTNLGTEGVFFTYGVVALLGTGFVWFFLPETQGKTLEQIQEYFGNYETPINEDKKFIEEEKCSINESRNLESSVVVISHR